MVQVSFGLIANAFDACNTEQAACLGQYIAESSSSHANCANRLTEGWWTFCLTWPRRKSQESLHACLYLATQQQQRALAR